MKLISLIIYVGGFKDSYQELANKFNQEGPLYPSQISSERIYFYNSTNRYVCVRPALTKTDTIILSCIIIIILDISIKTCINLQLIQL